MLSSRDIDFVTAGLVRGKGNPASVGRKTSVVFGKRALAKRSRLAAAIHGQHPKVRLAVTLTGACEKDSSPVRGPIIRHLKSRSQRRFPFSRIVNIFDPECSH